MCLAAAAELRAYLGTRSDWHDEIAAGKMFGVLVVSDNDGNRGFLAAFSGNLAGSNDHDYFVPAVYDMLRPGDFFRREEAAISDINRRVERLETADERLAALRRVVSAEEEAAGKLTRAREELAHRKAERDERRQHTCDRSDIDAMIRESQHLKAEYRRLKRDEEQRIAEARAASAVYEDEIAALKAERKRRSEALQMRLFGMFEMRNARGETRNLCDIFAPAPQHVPPAGAGECAAPKLLQYAYVNGYRPLALAEFWLGRSPVGEIRHEGYFYPACRGKCGPILAFMLEGLDIERHVRSETAEPRIMYEDLWIAVVEKPAGMLSVDGKRGEQSVAGWARRRFADAERVMVVHRLDMDTSGILVIAKDLGSYRNLQAQFHDRSVGKRYTARLDGDIVPDNGRIELPLRPDPLDRPRQVVDANHGKPAVTEYRVTARHDGLTDIEFRPLTGRTHQLRVHAAHRDGLGAPIVGDALYGRPSTRLHLHASHIEFRHPATGEKMSFDSSTEF